MKLAADPRGPSAITARATGSSRAVPTTASKSWPTHLLKYSSLRELVTPIQVGINRKHNYNLVTCPILVLYAEFIQMSLLVFYHLTRMK